MSDNRTGIKHLQPHERRAIQRAVRDQLDKFRTEQEFAKAVGVSQQSINRAALHGEMGGAVAMAVLNFLGVRMQDLCDTYGIKPEEGPRVNVVEALAQYSEPVTQLMKERGYLRETGLQLELYFRARDRDVSPVELSRIGDAYDAANIAAQERRELAALRQSKRG